MSRIIHTQRPGQNRQKLMQALALSVRTYDQQNHTDHQRVKDILAFITLTLRAIEESVEQTVEAWEKRGYWMKADRFHQEWLWVFQASSDLALALDTEDGEAALEVCGKIFNEIKEISIPTKMRTAHPWEGAWKRWKE